MGDLAISNICDGWVGGWVGGWDYPDNNANQLGFSNRAECGKISFLGTHKVGEKRCMEKERRKRNSLLFSRAGGPGSCDLTLAIAKLYLTLSLIDLPTVYDRLSYTMGMSGWQVQTLKSYISWLEN